LEVIRGRQGRLGFRQLSLCTLLDIIWAEIYDDCSPMGDVHQYREVVSALYIEGRDPHDITYKDAKGKTRRLADAPASSGVRKGPSQSAHEAMRAMQERARELAEARKLASPPDE